MWSYFQNQYQSINIRCLGTCGATYNKDIKWFEGGSGGNYSPYSPPPHHVNYLMLTLQASPKVKIVQWIVLPLLHGGR